MKIVIAHGGNIGFQGGGTIRVLTFANALAEHGFDVTLVVPKPIGDVSSLLNDKIKVEIVPITPKSIWDQVLRAILVGLKAKKVAEREKAVLQIEHSTLGGVMASLGCSNYILDIHDLEFDGSMYKTLPLGSNLIYHLERKAVSEALKIVVVSEPMKDFLMNEWNIPEDKIEIIPNGYFEEKIKKFNGKINEEEGLISFIGVFTHNIDYSKVIKLAESRDDIKIYMIGEGPMRSEFIKMIKTKGLKSVLAPGFLPDNRAYSILAKSQVCIFPLKNTLHTRVAGHMKTFDYAALGKAIATDRDGTAVIFERNYAALVSDPAKPEEFIENVHRLLEDDNLRRKLGRNAKKLVEDFTWKKQGEKLVMMYEKLGEDR